MKKIIGAIIFLFIVFGPMAYLSYAQDETSEATPSDQIKEKIKQRLEKTATDSAEIDPASSASPSATFYAYFGTLSGIDSGNLSITMADGDKEAETDTKTTIFQTDKGKSRKEVTADKLTKGNFIIAIGTFDNDIIKATRVYSTVPTTPVEKETVYGKVSEAEDTKITVKNGEQSVLPITDKTSVVIQGIEKAKASDIQLEDSLYAVVVTKNGKITETRAIYIIPGKNNSGNKNNQSAKPETSAKPTASPSPSPKASVKPKASPSPLD